MPNLYATLSELKLQPSIPATGQDSLLLRLLGAASRQVDNHCGGRHFFVRQGVRYFDCLSAVELLVRGQDLLAVNELKSDEDGDLDYDITWTTGDYVLYPYNTFPIWKLMVHPNGDYAFPAGLQTVKITGSWGYGDGERAAPWNDTGATATINISATSLSIATGTVAAGQTILIGNEQLYVSAVTAGSPNDTATVQRAVNGTTAAAHDTAAVKSAAYPAAVTEVAVWLATMAWQRAGHEAASREQIDQAVVSFVSEEEIQRQMARCLGPLRRLAV